MNFCRMGYYGVHATACRSMPLYPDLWHVEPDDISVL